MRGIREAAAAVGAGLSVRLQVVGAEPMVAGPALDQRVGEGVGVAGGDPHLGVHEDGGIQANHVVPVLDESLPPGVPDVALQLNAQRAVVVRGSEAAIDLAGLEYEAPALAQRHDFVHFYPIQTAIHVGLQSVGLWGRRYQVPCELSKGGRPPSMPRATGNTSRAGHGHCSPGGSERALASPLFSWPCREMGFPV